MTAIGTTAVWGATDWSSHLILGLQQQSALALGGVRLIPITGRSVKVPRLVTDPAASWTGELEEIDSDAGDADLIELIPRKLANLVDLSTEAIEDAPLNELEAVGAALVRGVARALDAKVFSADAAAGAPSPAPAGLLSYALPAAPGDVDLAGITGAVGQVDEEGGEATVCWLAPSDLTGLRLESLVSTSGPLTDVQEPGIEKVAGARLVKAPLPPGTAIVADPTYLAAAVRRDAAVRFSTDSGFSRDAVQARVTMRVDYEPADLKAFAVLNGGS